MKPIYKYLGGKSRELKYFRNFIPKNYEIYVEPFFGGGAVFWDQEPDVAHINDLDLELMTFLDFVRHDVDKINEVVNWPVNKEFFLNLRDSYGRNIPNDELKSAQRYFYFLRTSFNGCLRYNAKKDRYNMSFGGERPIKPISKEAAILLQNTIISSMDWERVFEQYEENEKAFIFLDPPYEGLFSYLLDSDENKEKGRELLVRLSDKIRKAKAKCLLTINKTPFTEELFADLVVSEYRQKQTFGAHCHGKDLIKETFVVANYDVSFAKDDSESHDNKLERQKITVFNNIKRKEKSFKMLKIDTICIEGPDKTGKDTLAAYLSQMTRDLIITVRGMISNISYHRLLHRKECEYDVKSHSHELYVLLDAESMDQMIRCKLTDEEESYYEQQRRMFRVVADEFKDKGLVVIDANTSEETPYRLAQRILSLIDGINNRE